MKQFTVWYTDADTYRGYFMAESKEQAENLLAQVAAGEMAMSDLLNFDSTNKGCETEVFIDTLAEVN